MPSRIGAVSEVLTEDGLRSDRGLYRSQTRLRTVDLQDGGYKAGSLAQGSRSPAARRRLEPQHSTAVCSGPVVCRSGLRRLVGMEQDRSRFEYGETKPLIQRW